MDLGQGEPKPGPIQALNEVESEGENQNMSLFQSLQCPSLTSKASNPKPKPKTKTQTHHLFDQIPHTTTTNFTFSWNALLRSHLHNRNPIQTLISFNSMLLSNTLPDSHTLPLVLSASLLSNNFSISEQIHALSLKLDLSSNPFVLSSLIQSYAHFQGPSFASSLLTQSTSVKNTISWTLLLQLCLKESKPGYALQLFDQMLGLGVELDSVVLVTVAKACGLLKSVSKGKWVHKVAERNGFFGKDDVLVGNSIVKMYLECGRIEEARAMFEGMKVKDLVTWTTVISGYVQNGGFNDGLKLFRAMCGGGVRPDSFSVSAVLPACARMAAHNNGREIHGKIIRLHLGMNSIVENALMDMYVKSGSVGAALKIFDRMVCKDSISWTVMILGHSLYGQGEAGVELFKIMKEKGGVSPDRTTFSAALHAANTACLVEEGKFFFNLIAKPEGKHYALMAGLLSRGGYFIEARSFVEKHQLTCCATVHRAVLDGCRIHRNVRLGKRIVEQLIELEPLNAENYVMLSNMYAANEKWEMANKLRDSIGDMGLKTKKAYSWIEMRNKVHVFGTGDVSHPRSEGIYWELERLRQIMRQEERYVAKEDYSLHDVDEERECIPCGHSEMLAIGLGLISGSRRSGVLRVTKNLRVCLNCHDLAKFISRNVAREIVLKDPDRFHHFSNGTCSCRDVW